MDPAHPEIRISTSNPHPPQPHHQNQHLQTNGFNHPTNGNSTVGNGSSGLEKTNSHNHRANPHPDNTQAPQQTPPHSAAHEQHQHHQQHTGSGSPGSRTAEVEESSPGELDDLLTSLQLAGVGTHTTAALHPSNSGGRTGHQDAVAPALNSTGECVSDMSFMFDLYHNCSSSSSTATQSHQTLTTLTVCTASCNLSYGSIPTQFTEKLPGHSTPTTVAAHCAAHS